jgi:hypothetical protein
MKEDSALLAGVAVTMLAALAYAQSASVFRAAILGLGCGLAISGKYLGVVVLAVAVPAIWFDSSPKRIVRAWWFVGTFAFTLLLINFPLIVDVVHPARASLANQSLGSEMSEVVHGQGELTRSVPHLLYWNVFIDNSTPAIWVLLLAFLTRTQPLRRHERIVERLLAWFPLALAILLSFSPKENDRYFLPSTAMFTLLAAIGTSYMPNLVMRIMAFFGSHRPEAKLSGRARELVVYASVVLLLLLQLTGWASTKPGLLGYDQAFLHDDISDLTAWMRTNIPAGALVLADSRCGLQAPGAKKKADRVSDVPQQLIVQKHASDKYTLEERRSQGVTYVVVSETSYGRFFRGDLHAKDEGDPKYLHAKNFYETLLRGDPPLFQRERGTVIYLHPGIRVYQL